MRLDNRGASVRMCGTVGATWRCVGYTRDILPVRACRAVACTAVCARVEGAPDRDGDDRMVVDMNEGERSFLGDDQHRVEEIVVPVDGA
jgi:hypothetical protein